MGAYENPPLIIQPNYGEIFAQNAQNIMAIAEQRKEEAARKRKEKEARILQAGEKTSAYVRRANNIKAGALTENITQAALGFGDKKFEIEDAFAKGQMSAEEYNEANFKLEASLNTLASAGSALVQFENTIKDLDLSSYQTNPEVFGLIQAYKDGAVDFEIIDGKVELHYEAGGQKIEVDETWLSNPNSWDVVEKFDSDAVTSGLADVLKKQITNEESRIIETDEGKIATTEQRYSKAYGDENLRRDQLLNNSVVRDLDQNELGSYYKDRLAPNMSMTDLTSLDEMLKSENYAVLNNEQKNKIKSIVQNGDWSNEKIKVGDQEVNIASVLAEFSKRRLVEEAMSKVPAPATRTATTIDQTTPPVTATQNIGGVILNDIEAAGENAKLQQFTGKTISLGNVSGRVVGATKKSDTNFLFSVEIGTGKEKRTVPAEISIAREDGRNAMKELMRQAIAGQQGISQKAKEQSLAMFDEQFNAWLQPKVEDTMLTAPAPTAAELLQKYLPKNQ